MAPQRDQWSSRTAFVMAAVGSAVGLGNVWRFPFICYDNGGGAFLIAFLVALFTAGIPLMILEFGLGHMTRSAAPTAFAKINKSFEWLGWLAVLIGLMVMTYYGVVMGWCFNYLKYSFNMAWGADTEAFFYSNFLQLSGGIGELGGVVWYILLGLLLCWVSVFLCIYKGVETVSKVIMVTVPVPVLILVVFFIRGMTLPGAIDGLKYFLTPDFNALLNPKVWLQAYGQVFFSLSIGFGVMIAYASFLPKKADIVNSAFMTSLADAGISFLAGLAVFTTLGYLAQQVGKPVTEVLGGGPGLAFVTYPTIINHLPFAPALFGFLFFTLLLTLGIDSAFSLVEAGVAGGMDKWKFARLPVNLTVSTILFVIGILYTTKAGLYWLDIIDHYMTNFGLAFVGIMECIVVGYVFGAKKMREHVNATSDFKIGYWWDFCILFLTPAILFAMICLNLWDRINAPYEGYPAWAQIAGGWGLLGVVCVVALLLTPRWKIVLSVIPGVVIAVFVYLLLSGVSLSVSAKVILSITCTVIYGGFAYCIGLSIKANKEYPESKKRP
ncbi:sodium-dependent transporter [Patescibacteria group bacterium]|nr:sodium-dependent transporter [Patescibacteria group bacterium]